MKVTRIGLDIAKQIFELHGKTRVVTSDALAVSSDIRNALAL